LEQGIRAEVARDDRCAGRARLIIAEQLSDISNDERRENILLVTSELVTNAYQHGVGRIELRVRRSGEQIRIDVIDQGRAWAVKIRDAAVGVGGWGLRIVDQLTSDWGVLEGRTHVWATLPAG
jgi:anti-sigma regulatory factor (Ser/Thr protein kinase)